MTPPWRRREYTVGLFLLWPVMLVWTYLGRKETRRPALVRATAYYYSLCTAFFAYVTGPFHATAGFALFAGLITGRVLFDRRVTLEALLVYVGGLVLITTLSHQGVLPFQPLYLDVVGPRGLEPGYLVRSTVAAVVLGLIAIPVVAVIVESWSYREVQLRHAARVDALTGVANRGRVMEILDSAFARANEDSPLSVVLADVDHFKRVNDQYGHLVGDDVLRDIAQTLEDALRRTDRLGRYGGEEFVMVLPGASHAAALGVAERCREAVEALSFTLKGGDSLRVTISLGVATCPPERPTLEGLLADADEALYRAKGEGRNAVRSALQNT